MVVSGSGVGLILAEGGGMGYGQENDGRTGEEGIDDGSGSPKAESGIDSSFGQRNTICLLSISGIVEKLWNGEQHVETGRLSG